MHAAVANIKTIYDGVSKRSAALDDSPAHGHDLIMLERAGQYRPSAQIVGGGHRPGCAHSILTGPPSLPRFALAENFGGEVSRCPPRTRLQAPAHQHVAPAARAFVPGVESARGTDPHSRRTILRRSQNHCGHDCPSGVSRASIRVVGTRH